MHSNRVVERLMSADIYHARLLQYVRLTARVEQRFKRYGIDYIAGQRGAPAPQQVPEVHSVTSIR